MATSQVTPESRGKLESRIRELRPWFHNIEIAPGVYTNPGSSYPWNRWQLLQELLPASLQGQVCLDIGCNAGFFSLKLRERGAALSASMTRSRWVNQANFVKEALSADKIEYRVATVY